MQVRSLSGPQIKIENMQPVKYLKIDSFEAEDTNALFEAMCKNIANMTPFEGKCRILDLSGNKEKIDSYRASFADVLKFIKKYDVKFDFKVNYVSSDPADEKKKDSPNFSVGQFPDSSKALMQAQKDEIQNPELKELIKTNPVIPDQEPIVKRDFSSIPPPPDLG